ncbi:lipoprotein insertase outer membrane protein LolB [uncultured Aquabacterium sp.]|tara:strand:+ start:685 stop:1374 length:690 start_codon:yes stop_codon:yes gene_type:complete
MGMAMTMAGCASAWRAPQAGATDGSPTSTAPASTTTTTSTATDTAPALPALAAIDLQGQISIKLLATDDLPAKGVSLGFFFNGQPDAGRLDLMTPLGSQIAQVGWSPTGAWLRRSGGSGGDAPPESRFGTDLSATPSPDDGLERFDHIGALSERVLGEAIPLQTLIHWMQGRADPQRPSTAAPDAELATGTFTQDGWLIDTREWPRRLQAQRAASPGLRGIQLKVHLDR